MAERLRTRIEEVTSRQLEVARLLAEGRTNPEIASALGITLDGAKYHVSELLGRLGLDRREEVAEWYRTERRGQRLRRLSALFATAPRAFLAAAGLTAVVAVGFLLVAALEGGRADDPVVAASATPTASVTSSEPGVTPPVGAVGDASDVPSGLQSFPATLAQRLGSATLPTVVSWERVDWFDGCFEVTPPGGCPLSVSPVPGYRVVLDHRGEEYVAHTALDAGRYALASAPAVEAFDVVFRWTGAQSDAGFLCLDLQLSADGFGSIASCGEARTPVDLTSDNDADQHGFLDRVYLTWLLGRGAFDIADAGRPSIPLVRSRGSGPSAPPGVQRSAEEWGRLEAVQAYTGSAPVDAAIATWTSAGSSDCPWVRVAREGIATRGDCAGDQSYGRILPDTDLERLYIWLDGYQSFDREERGARVAFEGLGPRLSDGAFRDEVQAWLTSIAASQGDSWAGPTSVE